MPNVAVRIRFVQVEEAEVLQVEGPEVARGREASQGNVQVQELARIPLDQVYVKVLLDRVT